MKLLVSGVEDVEILRDSDMQGCTGSHSIHGQGISNMMNWSYHYQDSEALARALALRSLCRLRSWDLVVTLLEATRACASC